MYLWPSSCCLHVRAVCMSATYLCSHALELCTSTQLQVAVLAWLARVCVQSSGATSQHLGVGLQAWAMSHGPCLAQGCLVVFVSPRHICQQGSDVPVLGGALSGQHACFSVCVRTKHSQQDCAGTPCMPPLHGRVLVASVCGAAQHVALCEQPLPHLLWRRSSLCVCIGRVNSTKPGSGHQLYLACGSCHMLGHVPACSAALLPARVCMSTMPC